MKAIAAGFASLLLVPVLVLGASADGGSAWSPTEARLLGDRADLVAAVLGHPGIGLTPSARADVEAGRVDARILGILLAAAQERTLDRVGPAITGHSFYVRGTTRVSNHVSGRAIDILAVDGAPVSSTNLGARALMEQILTLPAPLAPDELGGPWVLSVGSRSSFSDAAHADHIHAGFDA